MDEQEKKRRKADYDKKWYKRNKGKIRDYQKGYYKKWLKKNREKKVEYIKKWMKENKRSIIEYRKKNKERLSKNNREWRIKNKEHIKKYEQTPKRKINRKVRDQTRRKYGKLMKGFQYHHNTNPPHKDKFIVLEEKFHKFYHDYSQLFDVRNTLINRGLVEGLKPLQL